MEKAIKAYYENMALELIATADLTAKYILDAGVAWGELDAIQKEDEAADKGNGWIGEAVENDDALYNIFLKATVEAADKRFAAANKLALEILS